MPRKPCYWNRKLELELVEFVRQRDYIWKPVGNTNHHIQQKYKAYAEFASKVGHGFTARAVRDRWVNIRSTFNHNVRRVEKSRESAQGPTELYVPCWPLWRPLQFLNGRNKSQEYEAYSQEYKELKIKEELQSEFEDPILTIRQRSQRTNRPRKKHRLKTKNSKCKRIIDDLVKCMKPLTRNINKINENTKPPRFGDILTHLTGSYSFEESINLTHLRGDSDILKLKNPLEVKRTHSYWFFGKHVTERLNNMQEFDGQCARREILSILEEFSKEGSII